MKKPTAKSTTEEKTVIVNIAFVGDKCHEVCDGSYFTTCRIYKRSLDLTDEGCCRCQECIDENGCE